VYVVDEDSRVHLKPVKVGVVTEFSSQILGGLQDGDQVVVDGTDRLVENAVVRVRKAGELENPPNFDPTAGAGRKGARGGFKKGGGDFKKGGGNFGKGRG